MKHLVTYTVTRTNKVYEMKEVFRGDDAEEKAIARMKELATQDAIDEINGLISEA